MGSKDSKTKTLTNIIILGLDNSGKSSMINRLKTAEDSSQEISATVGFKQEHFSQSNITFKVFDMSGQSKYRSLWEKYYEGAEAVIFVIDASDSLRFGVVKNEFDMLMENESKCKHPIRLTSSP